MLIDVVNRPVRLHDVVAVPRTLNRMDIGVVTSVYEDTDAVDITVVDTNHNPITWILHVPFPSSTIAVLDQDWMKIENPNHAYIIRHILPEES